ncbi:uncharacterized protein LOC126664209 [Mercurialis annua]|uniref:uncharacterized protein LOC126664209 n=1 Tax=Mercurialis annua TaxID=3986 RepID=UPI00216087D0|nr:uncharacterized protein LOC126664209 [Mercurialis annua]
MPNYVMNVFLIPHNLCDEFERMMNSFWWGRDQMTRVEVSKLRNNLMSSVFKASLWLVNAEHGYVQTIQPPNLSNVTVNQLLVEGGNEWDIGLVRDVFDKEDVDRILSVPVSSRNVDDRCVHNDVWILIWNVKFPLHIRNFMWRVCADYLPTVEALASRRVFVYATCMVCNSTEETVLHLLCDCSLAMECWKLVGLGVDRGNEVCVQSWCKSWLNKLTEDDQALAKKVHGTVDAIIAAAGNQYASWKVANLKFVQLNLVVVGKEDGRVRWTAPLQGWLKVNVDATVFLGRHAKGGAIIRNPSPLESELLAEDCVDLAKPFLNISFIFVGRSANQAAHVLAQYASSNSGHQKWFCHFTEYLANVTASDLIYWNHFYLKKN